MNSNSNISEARLRANRENAKKSKGPTSPEGKKRSSLNATRHGILSQVIHLPEEELKSYDEFTARYVASLQPVGAYEIELANACADLQFRLHRLAAAEHNLFSIGHSENGNELSAQASGAVVRGKQSSLGHPESHTALAFAETMRRSKDPLNTLSTYESRLSRRFLQTLKQLREMQAERRLREAQELEEMFEIASQHRGSFKTIENIDPNQFGFVCSARDWKLYYKRRVLLSTTEKPLSRAA